MDLISAPVDPAGAVDITVFAQYGILGIIAVILIWFAKGAHQRERDRADRMEEENRRLNQLILDRVIPALTSATNAAEESAELLNAIQREREMVLIQRDRAFAHLTEVQRLDAQRATTRRGDD